ncbi:hypothetical protein BDF19DRAFT_430599 [Syncephalis fuscata]|nr:hypothetical protein BDF19DRAFT_430599 [Syncephalis fuscata]
MLLQTWNLRSLIHACKARCFNIHVVILLTFLTASILIVITQIHTLIERRGKLVNDVPFFDVPLFTAKELITAPDAIRLDSAAQLLPTDFTVTKSHEERDSVVVVRNLCLNSQYGLFRIVDNNGDSKKIPTANIVTAGDSYDSYFQTSTVTVNEFDGMRSFYEHNGYSNHFVLLNETTFFLMETYFPSHYSHFLVNNLIPLLEVLNWHYSPEKDRLQYTTTLGWMKTRRHLYIHDRELQKENTCPVGGCAKIPDPALGTYTSLRRLVRGHFLSHDMVKQLEVSDAAAMKSKKLANGQRPRVVVVQRKGTRAFLNLDKIHTMLDGLDVEAKFVELEGYNMQQQVELFSNTDILIAVHGNAIGNLFWMPPSALIIEIWQYGWESNWFKYIADQLVDERNLQHQVISCSLPECALPSQRDPSFDAKNRAVYAPLDKLKKSLTDHGVKLKLQ